MMLWKGGINEEREKGYHNDVAYQIRQKKQGRNLRFSPHKTQPSPAFGPNGLNAGIKPRLGKSCVSRRREKVMIIDGI